MTPLLEAEGLSADPRQRAQWPTETLRRVLADLMEETPKDLVSRELWLGSLNAEQWWSSTLRFSRSCAVMSVIGYIIGLGDRHLDNVLVDLRCGEVQLHIASFLGLHFQLNFSISRLFTSITMFALRKADNYAFPKRYLSD